MPLHGFTSELQRAYETALIEQAGEGTGYRKSFEPLDPKPYACLKTFFVPSPFIYIFMLKPIGHILLTLLSIAYPLLWYYGREHGAFFWLAAAMCGLWLIRFCWLHFLPPSFCSGGLIPCIGILWPFPC